MLRFENWEWQIEIVQVKVEIKKSLRQLAGSKIKFVHKESYIFRYLVLVIMTKFSSFLSYFIHE